jgi:hypothetical protein
MDASVFYSPSPRPLYVRLAPEERDLLNELALRERRDPRDQAAMLIAEGLAARGLLKPAATQEASK